MLYVALSRTNGHLDVVHLVGHVPAQLLEDGAPQQPERQVGAGEDYALASTRAVPTEASGKPPEQTQDVEDAPPGAPAAKPARRDRRPSVGGASTSIRRTVVETNAQHVLDMLAEVAPEHMWADILDRARELTEVQP
jgi:hypothetical protein